MYHKPDHHYHYYFQLPNPPTSTIKNKSLFQVLDVSAFSRGPQDHCHSPLGEGIRPPTNEIYHDGPTASICQMSDRRCSQHRHLERCFQAYHFPFLNVHSSEYSVFLLHLTAHQSASKSEGYWIRSSFAGLCIAPIRVSMKPWQKCFYGKEWVRSGGIKPTNILDDLQNRFSGGQRTCFSDLPVDSAASSWLSRIQDFYLSEARGGFL